MSEFCSSCGAKITDATGICSNCNTNNSITPATNTVATATSPNSKDKKNIIAIVCIAIAVILVFALFSNIFGGGYKKIIKQYAKSIELQTNAFYSSSTLDYGKNIKVSIKIKDKEKLDKDEIEEIEEAYEERYDKKIKIKKAYDLECEYKIKGSKDKDTEENTLRVAKIKGKWYIINLMY